MAILGRDVLSRTALKRKTIAIPEWDGQIIIRELNGSDAIPVQQVAVEISQDRTAGKFDAKKAIRWQAQTVALGWINEDGSRVLQDGDIDSLLESQSHALIDRVAKEIRILSGMDKASPKDPSALEEAKKN